MRVEGLHALALPIEIAVARDEVLAGRMRGTAFRYPVVMDPTGRFLYLANVFAHSVTAFTVQGPQLSSLGLQPVIGASSLYLSPTGRWLYLSGQFGQNPHALFITGIDPTTGLLSLLPNEPMGGYTLPSTSDGFLVDPLGRFVWLTSSANGTETLCPRKSSVRPAKAGTFNG